MPSTVVLDGRSLTLEGLQEVASGETVQLDAAALQQVGTCRNFIETLVHQQAPIYGLNTGFGSLANTAIGAEELKSLQLNVVRSHAAGVGPALSREETRALLCLRLNVLLKSHSGVRQVVCQRLADFLNRGIHPVIPERGSVGASGDLCPLAHMSLCLIGEGTAEHRGSVLPTGDALKAAGLSALSLETKEGLALINGTQAMLAVGGLTVLRLETLARSAESVAALTLLGRCARLDSLDERIHVARNQTGQQEVAGRLRELLANTPGYEPQSLQDPYSLRCIAQVHGASVDAFRYVRSVVERELNAATDNPLAFPTDGKVLSGGNFHGQPLALALDFAAIAASELGSISERRLEQLLNPFHSGLPAFLTPDPGHHSGLMAAQYVAASLLNETKLWANPCSTDSVPGNANVEDHVSMGMGSALKLRSISEHLATILAIELMAAVEAVELRGRAILNDKLRPVFERVRQVYPPLTADRALSQEIESVAELVSSGL